METFINCIDAVRGENSINLRDSRYLQINFDARKNRKSIILGTFVNLQFNLDSEFQNFTKVSFAGSTGGTGFSAIKITALGRPEILVSNLIEYFPFHICIILLTFTTDVLVDSSLRVFGEDSKVLHPDHWKERHGYQGDSMF